MTTANPATICLWYHSGAGEAARFYAATFSDSSVGQVTTAPADFPDGRAGQELTVDFTVMGIPCMGLNGGDAFSQSEAFSFQVHTDTQEETDRYWNAIVGNGGTRYTARARHWKEEDAESHKAMGFEQGWGACADQLKALCEAG